MFPVLGPNLLEDRMQFQGGCNGNAGTCAAKSAPDDGGPEGDVEGVCGGARGRSACSCPEEVGAQVPKRLGSCAGIAWRTGRNTGARRNRRRAEQGSRETAKEYAISQVTHGGA